MDADTEMTLRYVRGEISADEFYAWVRENSTADLDADMARWVGEQRVKDMRLDARSRRWLFARRRRGAKAAWKEWVSGDRVMSVEFEAGYHYGVLDAQRDARKRNTQ